MPGRLAYTRRPAMSRADAPVTFDPPTLAEGHGVATWFRVFRRPACATILGRQHIGVA